jgi:hypothetical protein
MSMSTTIFRSDLKSLFPVIASNPSLTVIFRLLTQWLESILHRARKVANSPKYGFYTPGMGNLIRLQKLKLSYILGKKSATGIDFQIMHFAIPEK